MLDRLRDIHDRCVIHRDIKPENFLFKEEEYDELENRFGHFEDDSESDSFIEERSVSISNDTDAQQTQDDCF